MSTKTWTDSTGQLRIERVDDNVYDAWLNAGNTGTINDLISSFGSGEGGSSSSVLKWSDLVSNFSSFTVLNDEAIRYTYTRNGQTVNYVRVIRREGENFTDIFYQNYNESTNTPSNPVATRGTL